MNDQQTTISTGVYQEFPVQHNADLTTAEVAVLWNSFMHYSMLKCVFAYFEQQAGDSLVKSLMSEALERCKKRVSLVSDLLKKDNQPIPMGFSDQDVNINAAALYHDNFLLHYLQYMLRISSMMNGNNLNVASRSDIREFYRALLESSLRLRSKVDDILLSKGLLARAPVAALSRDVEFTHNPAFLTGFFREKRPLLAIETAHHYNTALSNQIGRILLLGFRQMSPDHDVRDFLTEGIEIAEKYIEVLSEYAKKEEIYFSFPGIGDLTDSSDTPFSDRLIMFHVNGMSAIGIGMYGGSMGASQRHDLIAEYGKMVLETGQYSEKGCKLAMDKGWLEEPPQVLNRDKLAEEKH